MPKFYASTSKGLTKVLAEELKTLGIFVKTEDAFGCGFEGNWMDCLKVNLCSRVATRVSLSVLEFPAYTDEEIYNNVMKHDFTKYLGKDQTFMVHGTVKESAMRDQRLAALKVKDAIADQFREKYGQRPNVNKEAPDSNFSIFGFKNRYHVSVDTSGAPLTRRGYRKALTMAPLREHLASGILNMTNWDGKTPIIDPMCGSGTFLIEAALMAAKIMPGTFRTSYSWQNFQHIETDGWGPMVDEVCEQEVEDLPIMFYGYDKDGDALRAAKENAKRAGVDHMIQFERRNAEMLARPEDVEKGIILTNPPYGIRMGDEFFLDELYKNFSFQLKQQYPGWDFWVLSGKAELTRNFQMKAKQKIPVMNGNIECRLIHYQLRNK